MRRFYRIFSLLLLVFLLMGCGGGAKPEPNTLEPQPTTEQAETPPTEEPEVASRPTEGPEAETPPTEEPEVETGAVASLQAVKGATIQIVAEGSFRDPEVGMQYNAAGSGSGFIIDESGLAVTNNHVVTGAALLKVYVGGDTDKSYNARVLGASECSDLALIDIEGEGFPFVEWYEGDVDVGLDVYAAGFPLGDPEFTLTRGIISKASADGETSWASVDSVIEHDATINPGNSGGPLVNADGQVVGINYAGASDTNQYFAIAREEALDILEGLREGDVTSIGVNGEAVSDGENLSGIWVSSVKSGSPADEAGVKGGDIITMLEGLVLATDGTMSDYCDILRSHDADDKLNVEVLRYDTEEVLAGQLNGRELEQSYSFAQALGEEVAEDTSSTGTPDGEATYTEYVTVEDETGQLQMEVPKEWADVNGAAWSRDDTDIGVAISAAPSLEDFNGTWTTPGVFFGASRTLAEGLSEGQNVEEELLNSIDFSDSCEKGERTEYEDALYKGVYDLWSNCDGNDVVFLVLSVVPEDRSFVALVQVQIVSDADLDALDHIFNSFVVTGTLE